MKKTNNDGSNDNKIVSIDYASDKTIIRLSIPRLLAKVLKIYFIFACIIFLLFSVLFYMRYSPDFYCNMGVKTCGVYYNTGKEKGYGENLKVIIKHYDFDLNNMKIKSYDEQLNNVDVISYGYPSYKDNENDAIDMMYTMRGKISMNQKDYDNWNDLNKNYHANKNNTLMNTLDTSGGASGGGLLVNINANMIIVGVNSEDCHIDDTPNGCLVNKDENEYILNTAARINASNYPIITKLITFQWK